MKSKAIAIIGGADGPTSVFIAGKRKKSIKQKVESWIYQYRRKKIIQKIKANPHSMEQVIRYAKAKWGYQELSKDSFEYKEEYRHLRASLFMQHQPELLGEWAEQPEWKSQSEEEIMKMIQWSEERERVAENVPEELFDIDLSILCLKEDGAESRIIVEKRFGEIAASCSGSKKQMRKFDEIFRRIYIYYGVTEEDIQKETKRYKSLVSTLAAV